MSEECEATNKTINGLTALALFKNVSYYQDIAKQALEQIQKGI